MPISLTRLALALCGAGLITACGGAAAPAGEDASPTPAPNEAVATDSAPATTVDGDVDAKVPGTDYDATASIACGFGGKGADQQCTAGVKRRWGEDGTVLVEVTKPDGARRALFFKGTEPQGADSAQADGSAGWGFSSKREDDTVTISFGPETYVIVDAFVEGG